MGVYRRIDSCSFQRNYVGGRKGTSALGRTSVATGALCLLLLGCDGGEDPSGVSIDDTEVDADEQESDNPVVVADLAEGEGERPADADDYSDDNFLVSTVEVGTSTGEVYEYKFFATPEGESAVVVQAGFDLPQPLEDEDVCPLHTFLKVADADAEVPSALLQSCLLELPTFGRDIAAVDSDGGGAFSVSDLRTSDTGAVEYDLGFRASYCSGGDGGKNAFINARCDDIEDRVDDTDGPLIGQALCGIHTMGCNQNNQRDQKVFRCDSHVTGGWLQLTGSLSIFPQGCTTTKTTKTRWQVAACVQPLVLKWKSRSIPGSFPSTWNFFANVTPGNWTTMTLYAGTASSGYLCTSGPCWQTRDFRVAVDQDPGNGRFRVANGWATMQGKSTSSSCDLDL